MQIRTLFFVCMTAVALLATSVGCWVVNGLVVEYRLAGRVQRAVDIYVLLFAAVDKIGQERPVTGNALLRDAPADRALQSRLAVVRRAADDALLELDNRIALAADPGAVAQRAAVHHIQDNLAAWRRDADETLKHPKVERDPDAFSRNLTGFNDVFDTTMIVLDMGDLAASQHDGTAVELMALARDVWAIRAALGQRTVPLMTAIDAGVMLTPAVLEQQARYAGVAESSWTPITSLVRRLVAIPDLHDTIVTARAAADAYERLCQTVIAAGRVSDVYPISALELGRTMVRTAPVLLRMRDQALASAQARVAQTRRDDEISLAIAGVVLALTVVSMIAVVMVLQRRIVWPVLALTDVIGRIARLEFDVAIPARTRMDEIGALAGALETLRRGAMASEENKKQIVHLSRHDPLTGLANRRALQERLETAVAMAERGQISAVLCLDLDRFKAVNDSFGHPVGDLLLRAVAGRLLGCIRSYDTASRLGGDEFVVLLAGVERPEQSAVVARQIVTALSQPFDLEGQIVAIGCSIGIATVPQDAKTAADLLKNADTALYRTKHEEKGGFRFFRPEMDEHLRERMAMEQDLREAVERQAFELVYQPQYRLSPHGNAADRLIGFEALLRWRHPERGMIPPDIFIPLAEKAGLINQIGAWVLRHACIEAMRWPHDITLAVNLSAVQLTNPALVPAIAEVLARTGFPPRRLELEITETAALNEDAGTREMLQQIRGMGIRIAMDDFGTGYSSLSYLRRFPFDTIKIDKAFVNDLSDHPSGRAIVRAVVALANGLGMTTTAEGVETADQLAVLRHEGCDAVQGYLFSPPISAPAARAMLAEQALVAV
jgi:diguanylate cyclase (GGDEF)-like protein